MRRSIILIPLLLAACGESDAPDDATLTLLHVTEPRLVGLPADPLAEANRQAFAAAMQRFQARPGHPAPPTLLVVSGTLAAPRAAIVSPTVARPDTAQGDTTVLPAPVQQPADTVTGAPPTSAEVDVLAGSLSGAAVSDVYLALPAADSAWTDSLRARTLPGGMRVHDLTACYRGAPPRQSCTADVAGTRYRLVGFAHAATDSATLEHLRRLLSLTKASGPDHDVVVVAADAPTRAPTGTATDSAVVAGIAQQWDSVVILSHAVLGGEELDRRSPSPKLLRTPALGSAQPVASLSATRAAGYVTLSENDPRQEVLRYQAAFTGEAPPTAVAGGRLEGVRRVVRWLWNIDPNAGKLPRAVILAIAFIAAHLTIAALWRLQDGGTEVTVRQTTTANGASESISTTTTPPLSTPTLAFDNNFSRTVLSGLAGLVVLTFMQTAWKDIFPQANSYYVVWFVVLFLTLLLAYALLRGVTEVIRNRVAVIQNVPAWARPRGSGRDVALSWLGYWVGRFFRWVASVRIAVLVFLDTVLAIVLGRNQLRSAVWEDTIVNLHWSLYEALERERQDLERALQAALEREAAREVVRKRGEAGGGLFRVGISLMTPDESAVQYVVMSRGSLASRFPRTSLAWVAARTGVVRWWKQGHEMDEQRILYAGRLDGQDVELKLKDYFEPRTRSSYEAFLVVPLPIDRHDLGPGHRRGAIHISLRYRELFDVLWPDVDPDPAPGAETAEAPVSAYRNWERVFSRSAESCLGPLLENAAGVVGILLQRFNPDIFEQHIRPNRRDLTS
jgi:hypothetical protein